MAGLDGRPLSSVAEADLMALIKNRVDERKTLDYKLDLPGATDKERNEFLNDLSSFANTAGGHLIFGMEEDGGIPTALRGLGATAPDKEVLRLEGMREAGIRPRVPGVEFQPVPLSSGSYALVVRIPRSWASPHMTEHRFWGRNSKGKYRLDVDELRTLYAVKETVTDRARLFWIDRVNRVVSGETVMPLGDGAKIMLGLFPIASFDPSRPLSMPPRLPQDLAMTRWLEGSSGSIYDFDGIVNWGSMRAGTYSWYTQIFRTGGLEFVDGLTLASFQGSLIIPSVGYETTLVEALGKLLKTLSFISQEPPAVCFLALVGIGEHSFADSNFMPSNRKLGRAVLMLPPIMVEDFFANASVLLKPLFDMVWNAYGFERSRNFDKDGVWNPRG